MCFHGDGVNWQEVLGNGGRILALIEWDWVVFLLLLIDRFFFFFLLYCSSATCVAQAVDSASWCQEQQVCLGCHPHWWAANWWGFQSQTNCKYDLSCFVLLLFTPFFLFCFLKPIFIHFFIHFHSFILSKRSGETIEVLPNPREEDGALAVSM